MNIINTSKVLLPALLLVSCVKVTLHNTDHPEVAQIAVAADWSDRGEGVAQPAECTVKVGSEQATVNTAKTDIWTLQLAPASYHINIWNAAEGITVAGNTASADLSNPVFAAPMGAATFFTGVAEQTVEADRDYTVAVAMHQQIRQLGFTITPSDEAARRIAAIDATLSGVATSLDLNTGMPTGSSATIAFGMSRQANGTFAATLCLPAVAGSAQTLTLNLRYDSGSPSEQTLAFDISDKLAAFNRDKAVPMNLNAITTVSQTATGFTASVSPWTEGGSTIIAE